MSRALTVGIADILHQPGARRHVRVGGPLQGLQVADSVVPPDTEVIVDANLESVSEGILVTGTVSARFNGECRRCLGPVDGDVRAEVRDLFEDEATEGESYPLRHEQIDLEPLARDAVLLELPLAPLCHAECQGLCPTCGADLNEGQCDCSEAPSDPRWAALDALKTDSE